MSVEERQQKSGGTAMTNADALKAQMESIRQGTMDMLTDLKRKISQLELPELPKEIEEYEKKFVANTYNVLVAGEAKRGKSSFVNALIGRDLLPTDVAVATNQVFRVSYAERESYRLRFEDESMQEISAADLPRYGSQVVADEKGASPVSMKLLRWIEVDVPVRFLPPNVSLLDTPGLGSLYAAHAEITQRFVPLADAVIFVLDSTQPIIQRELEFIDTILKGNNGPDSQRNKPHIFFIQTKIDLRDKEEWQQIQQRNETILRERFQEVLGDYRVWPISSSNLMKAAQTHSPGILKVSRQQELIEALEIFLFKTAGWNRCAEALLIADHYYTAARKILTARVTGLEAKTTQELSEIREQITESGQQFDEEWGLQGKKRYELQLKIQRIANTSKQKLIDLLETGGELEMTQRRKIDALKSIDEANKLGTVLAEQVVIDATGRWHTLCDQSRQQYSLLLGSLAEDTDVPVLPVEVPNDPIRIGPVIEVEDDIWAKLGEAQQEFIKGGNVAWVAAVIASIFIPSLTVGTALIGVAVAGIWAARRGWQLATGAQLKDAQEKLYDHLAAVMQEVRKHFLFSDLHYDGHSLVSCYFEALAQAMNERIEDIVERKRLEVQREKNRLSEEISMDRQQREVKVAERREQLAEWDSLGAVLSSIAEELKELERFQATPAL
jgi:GTPase SAR1 family protein